MTMMFDRFFGVPQAVMRDGTWAKLKPGEKDLYIFVLQKSERYSNRQITATDAEIRESTGAASRTLCNARKKLHERGLLGYAARSGNKYQYELWNPETRQPYLGDPKTPYRRKANGATERCTPNPTQPPQIEMTSEEIAYHRGLWEQQ